MDLTAALGEAHYCIWCHEQGKDSCARGLAGKEVRRRRRARDPVPQEPVRRRRSPGVRWRRRSPSSRSCAREGWPVAALAIMCVDNPMVAATGHRICNDCMKSLHLPEDGSGRRAAVGDAHPEGRARAAVGLRDLQPADALESAQPAAPAAAAGDRQARARRRHGTGGLHARPSPAERRPRGRRASTASRSSRSIRRCPASPSRASARRSRRSATRQRSPSRSTTG